VLSAEVKGEWVRLQMGEWKSECLDVELGCGYRVDLLNTGVAHAVHWVNGVAELQRFEWEKAGLLIRSDKHFHPEGANASAAVVDASGVVHLRTFERGVEGETLACGTGALAAARLGVLRGWCSFPVEVMCRSGESLVVDDAAGFMVLAGRAMKMEEGVWSGGDWV
jgi:diaminopimelate epimerase